MEVIISMPGSTHWSYAEVEEKKKRMVGQKDPEEIRRFTVGHTVRFFFWFSSRSFTKYPQHRFQSIAFLQSMGIWKY